MKNLTATISTLANDADGICESQSGTGGTALTFDGVLVSGGKVTLTYAQPVTVTSAGNDSGITFSIVGKDPNGASITVSLTGGNTTTATTAAYFTEVSSVTPSGNTASTVTVGVLSASGAVTKSLRCNSRERDFKMGIFVDVTGTLTYTAQYTYDQPEDTYSTSYSVDADWRTIDGLSGQTTDAQSNLAYPINAIRLKVTSYTSGSVQITGTQGT